MIRAGSSRHILQGRHLGRGPGCVAGCAADWEPGRSASWAAGCWARRQDGPRAPQAARKSRQRPPKPWPQEMAAPAAAVICCGGRELEARTGTLPAGTPPERLPRCQRKGPGRWVLRPAARLATGAALASRQSAAAWMAAAVSASVQERIAMASMEHCAVASTEQIGMEDLRVVACQ